MIVKPWKPVESVCRYWLGVTPQRARLQPPAVWPPGPTWSGPGQAARSRRRRRRGAGGGLGRRTTSTTTWTAPGSHGQYSLPLTGLTGVNCRSLPNICKEKPTIKHAWRGSDEEEEKFRQEILSDEPSLIKLYLQQRGDRNSWNGTSKGDIGEWSEASGEEQAFNNKVSSQVIWWIFCNSLDIYVTSVVIVSSYDMFI